MGEWLATNWFQVLTLLGIVFSWAVHYGISTARWKSMSDKVDEMEVTLNNMQSSFQVHTANSEIHISGTLLKLFDERSDFIKQQFSETRADIQRIEEKINLGK
ncbi:MAG: hypothetical protein IPL32_20015 [Chloracidobacterium sp.]|nr:hypothetical protein [Chloracidobacterium sp.]